LTTIALLTDFGTRDPYVASMKGVIAARCRATIHDLTHEIAPQDVFEAAWFLRTAASWWPDGTIVVAVVDPGVGTARRIVAAEIGGKRFLAPDNGLLSLLEGTASYVSVENEALFLPEGSHTFHGRDRFAPVAAALANGTSLQSLGPLLGGIVRLSYQPPTYSDRRVAGTIVAVDRFGNLITDIERSRVGFDSIILHAGELTIRRIALTYVEGGTEPFLIVGSTGCIEISIANGSAAARLGLGRGDRVEIVAE
jgi:S-adenosylmethionine hydrolase